MKRFTLSVPFAALLLFFGYCQVGLARAQTSQTPAQDPQAVSILQQSIKAMGGTVPADSTATGTIQTSAGGQVSEGTIEILTKGTAETLVQRTMNDGTWTTIYAYGQANDVLGSSVVILPLEPTVTSQAPEFPLPLIGGLLNDPDTSLRYIGLESSGSSSLYHIQAWDSYASQPSLQSISSFTSRDIWIDASTFLPQRISYTRRPAQGAAAGVAFDVYYSSYKNTGGVLYPTSIQKSMNGTPWAVITIQNVTFNTGLTDAEFPVQ